ncbi:hypothetical protein TNCV_4895731 [Trichonephila clavipes]|nr:hypothetical protein TNCV_4895731 [Trichonephila clavipes]
MFKNVPAIPNRISEQSPPPGSMEGAFAYRPQRHLSAERRGEEMRSLESRRSFFLEPVSLLLHSQSALATEAKCRCRDQVAEREKKAPGQ